MSRIPIVLILGKEVVAEVPDRISARAWFNCSSGPETVTWPVFPELGNVTEGVFVEVEAEIVEIADMEEALGSDLLLPWPNEYELSDSRGELFVDVEGEDESTT